MRPMMALALLLLVPAAAAQAPSTPTALYVHLINVQDASINTQEPPAIWTEDSWWSVYQPTVTCFADPLRDVAPATGMQLHTWRAYGSPSLVEYSSQADETPRTRPARGVWGNVSIDTAQPMALHWFLRTTHGGAGTGDETRIPNPDLPNVLVRATIRSGARLSVDDSAYDEGRLLFSGEAGPATFVQDQEVAAATMGTVRAASQVDGDWVYEFVVPLEAVDPVLPVDEGYNLRVDALVDNPACQDPDAATMTGGVSAHSSAGMRPRLLWSVFDPLAPGHVALGLDEDGMMWTSIHAATVFGPSDITGLDITLVHVAADGMRTPVPLASKLVSGYGPCGHDCGHTMETRYFPADPELVPGIYNLTVAYANLQGTAQRTMSAELVVEPPQESPPVPAGWLALGLVCLATVLRRR